MKAIVDPLSPVGMAEGYVHLLRYHGRKKEIRSDRVFTDTVVRGSLGLEVPRDTVLSLLRGEPVAVTREMLSQLLEAAYNVATPPWSLHSEKRWLTVYEAMGEFGKLVGDRANEVVHDALRAWVPAALKGSSAGDLNRLFYGMIASYVLIAATEPRRMALRNTLDPELLKEALDPATRERVSRVLVQIQSILASLPNQPSGKEKLGLDLTRFRLATFQIGVLHVDGVVSKAVETAVRAAVKRGYVDQALFVSEIYRNRRVYPLTNAWLSLLYTGAWQQSVEFAKNLFTEDRFLSHIGSEVQGRMALIRDRDHWIGFAAIVAYDDIAIPALSKARKVLDAEKASDQTFASAMRRLEPMFRSNRGADGVSFRDCQAVLYQESKE
ncbi:hypothetical protein ACVFYP_27405 [Roseomonas sp. F4]